jgi:hypothetical protein
MENVFRRAGIDVPEPVRCFLQGETDAWLRVEDTETETPWSSERISPVSTPRKISTSPSATTPCTSLPGAMPPGTRTNRATGAKCATGTTPAAARCRARRTRTLLWPRTSTGSSKSTPSCRRNPEPRPPKSTSPAGSPVTRGARELRDLTGSNTLPARYRTHQAAGARGEVPDAKRRTAHFGSTDTARTLRGAEPHPILPVRP